MVGGQGCKLGLGCGDGTCILGSGLQRVQGDLVLAQGMQIELEQLFGRGWLNLYSSLEKTRPLYSSFNPLLPGGYLQFGVLMEGGNRWERGRSETYIPKKRTA